MEDKALFLTPKDVAKRWSISRQTLERWRSWSKGVRYYKFGIKVRYSLSDIEAYERSRISNGTSQSTEI